MSNLLMRFFLISLFFSSICLEAIEKRATPIQLKTSVAVPCMKRHFKFLEGLLNSYANQTVIPDEIVISLSGVKDFKKEEKDKLNKLKQSKWPFLLKIVSLPNHEPAGVNRNTACSNASGDILLLQDADDFPHSQRVEFVKWFFENFDIDILQHGFIQSHNIHDIDYKINKEDLRYETLSQYGTISYIANGPICISRNVFEKKKWTEEIIHGEDVLYAKEIYKDFPKTVIIHNSLYLYRRLIE